MNAKFASSSSQSTIQIAQSYSSYLGPVMLDLEGKELTAVERELLLEPQVGGVIFFSRNYESATQLKNLVKEIRSIRPALLLAADQEGGRVQRFRDGFTRLPPLAEFGELYQRDPIAALQLAHQSAQTMAQELLAIGIDFSFAPVLDVDQGISHVIGDRSFSRIPKVVAELARAYIEGMHSVGMPAVGKHFPGHGAIAADSHKELPVDTRDFETIWEHDLVPYAMLSQQLAGIMTAHVVYSESDSKPASFSKFWLQQVLRKRLRFKGAIFSDDLSMNGAHGMGSYEKRARLALAAGCDMVLVCNQQQSAIQVLESLKKPIAAISQRRLHAMHARSH